MVPPVPAVVVEPTTVRPPLVPVVLRTMPLVAPLAEILRNVRPEPPIVVLATFSAVPVVDVIVLAVPVTVTVPPPVAAKPAPLVVLTARLPLTKSNVVPVLLVSDTA